MQPIPQGLKAISEAGIAKASLDKIMRPATYEQMAIAFKKLSLHCGKTNKNEEDIRAMFNDYCIDLKKYPITLINEACEAYRKLPEGNEFMPSSGKLIALMSVKWAKMNFLKSRIEKILGIYVEPAKKQNKVLSFDEALQQLDIQ